MICAVDCYIQWRILTSVSPRHLTFCGSFHHFTDHDIICNSWYVFVYIPMTMYPNVHHCVHDHTKSSNFLFRHMGWLDPVLAVFYILKGVSPTLTCMSNRFFKLFLYYNTRQCCENVILPITGILLNQSTLL